MTQPELDWFYGGGAGKFWPELWQRFVSVIPEDERDDLIAAYHKRLFSGDMREEMRSAPRGHIGKMHWHRSIEWVWRALPTCICADIRAD